MSVLAMALAATALAAGCAADHERVVPPDVPVAAPVVDEEWDRELAGGLQLFDFVQWDEDAPKGEAATTRSGEVAVIPIRVVDDVTGEPLAGARIDNWWEATTPHAEPWEDLLEGSWTTDRDGRALVSAANRGLWYYVDAPGYAPLSEFGFEDEYRLQRGTDCTIEVRDWMGRPAPGAVLDYVLGCGHTPNARCETAGPDGRLVLRCVNEERGDLWSRAAGIAGRNDGYGSWDDLPQSDGVRVLTGDPSPVLEGLVLRADGTPAGGARVGTIEAHRGPWTVAGADGRYRLVGAYPGDDLIAMAPYTDKEPEGFQPPQTEFLSVPGVVATVRLPAESRRWLTQEERDAEHAKRRADRDAYERGEEPDPTVPPEGPGIRVRVTSASGTTPTGRVRILLVRDGDGAAQETSPRFRDGTAARAIAAAPGAWTVTAGEVAGMLRPESRRVEVTAGWSDVAFVLQSNPVWKPRVVERLPDGTERDVDGTRAGTFRVLTEQCAVKATPHRDASENDDGCIYVPASGPFAVVYRAKDGRRARVLLDGPPQDAGPVLVLPPLPTDEPEVDESKRPREFPRARLQVLLPDGSPAAGMRIRIRSARPSVSLGHPAEERSMDLDDDGATSCSLDRTCYIEADMDGDDAEHFMPLFARIDGPGPWTIRWPNGTVDVRAVDEYGVPISELGVALLGWHTLDPVDGVVRLRGVGTAPLRFWVAAEGFRLHDLRLVLAPGEKRAVTVRMSRR